MYSKTKTGERKSPGNLLSKADSIEFGGKIGKK
jgi:hypothetical protein